MSDPLVVTVFYAVKDGEIQILTPMPCAATDDIVFVKVESVEPGNE